MRDPAISELEKQIEPIALRATDVDRPDGELGPDIALLKTLGWLSACLPHQAGGQGWGTAPDGARPALNALRALGRANLSVARLFEGHMNALKLVFLYGDTRQQETIADTVSNDGTLLGVWGADDPASALSFKQEGRNIELTGAKRFASGLGIVDHAVVTAAGPDGGQWMVLVPTNDDRRADMSAWQMAGMRATRSGRYDFNGLVIPGDALLGGEGDYTREPHFEGGIWRYCAAHLGGAEALYREMVAELITRKRADDTDQRRRVVACASALETSRLWLTRCADEIEAAGAGPDKAVLALLARQQTESACRKAIEIVDRALGMAAHEQGCAVERIKRDLLLFLCQAAPDAKRERAAEALVAKRVLPEML